MGEATNSCLNLISGYVNASSLQLYSEEAKSSNKVQCLYI